jgi:trimeric autotransporter adhesin
MRMTRRFMSSFIARVAPIAAAALFGIGVSLPVGAVTSASAYSLNYVQKAYVAYYGRPADPAGQGYWASRMDAEGGSLNAIIGAFGYSDEFNRRYGGLTNAALVTKIYTQALARGPDPAGLNYYVTELAAGRKTLQTITLDVLNGATTPPDSTIVANKLDVAAYYTAKVAAGCAYGTEQDGVNSLAGVKADPTTVATAKSAINSRCGF